MAAKIKKEQKKDYELLPVQEIEEIKEKLQKYSHSKNPIATDIESLNAKMGKLNEHIETINEIFDTAKDELELEKKEQTFIEQTFQPLAEKINLVEEQNRIIATALLKIVDTFKEQNETIIHELDNIKSKFNLLHEAMHIQSNLTQTTIRTEPRMQQTQPQFQSQPMSGMNIPQQPMPSQARIQSDINIDNLQDVIQQQQRSINSQSQMPNTNMQQQQLKPGQMRKNGLFSDLFK